MIVANFPRLSCRTSRVLREQRPVVGTTLPVCARRGGSCGAVVRPGKTPRLVGDPATVARRVQKLEPIESYYFSFFVLFSHYPRLARFVFINFLFSFFFFNTNILLGSNELRTVNLRLEMTDVCKFFFFIYYLVGVVMQKSEKNIFIL